MDSKEELTYLLKTHIPVNKIKQTPIKQTPQYKMLEKWYQRNSKDNENVKTLISVLNAKKTDVYWSGISWVIDKIIEDPNIKVKTDKLWDMGILNNLENISLKDPEQFNNIFDFLKIITLNMNSGTKKTKQIHEHLIKSATKILKYIEKNEEKKIKINIDKNKAIDFTFLMLNSEEINKDKILKEDYLSQLSLDLQELYYEKSAKKLTGDRLVEIEIDRFNFLLKNNMKARVLANKEIEKNESDKFNSFLLNLKTINSTDKWKSKIVWPYKLSSSELYSKKIESIYLAFEKNENKNEILENIMPNKTSFKKMIRDVVARTQVDAAKILGDFLTINTNHLSYGEEIKDTILHTINKNSLIHMIFISNREKLTKWRDFLIETEDKLNISLCDCGDLKEFFIPPLEFSNENKFARSLKNGNTIKFKAKNSVNNALYEDIAKRIPKDGLQIYNIWKEWVGANTLGEHEKSSSMKISSSNNTLQKTAEELIIRLNKSNLKTEISEINKNKPVQKSNKRKF